MVERLGAHRADQRVCEVTCPARTRRNLVSACLKCYTEAMESRTAGEGYLRRQLSDPSYAAAYERASRRIAMFDDVVRSLDARREELGMTKAELARRADMPSAVIRRLFSQQHKNPTLTSLVAIADALDLKICVASGQLLQPLSISKDASPSGTSRAYGTRRRTA
jgi:DNA-binding phage protein